MIKSEQVSAKLLTHLSQYLEDFSSYTLKMFVTDYHTLMHNRLPAEERLRLSKLQVALPLTLTLTLTLILTRNLSPNPLSNPNPNPSPSPSPNPDLILTCRAASL